MKDAKLKVAKRWCFPEGCQDRFLQILQNIGFLLKDAKMRARSVLEWVYTTRFAKGGFGDGNNGRDGACKYLCVA
ncbi:MAG: hypothetical protein HKL96_06110 [Phycisphaerales bacterium]|nr:hypothetical protein [Phycisphaerales bacterium]